MEPSRRPTRPMMDFIVVVLPAPLRPSRVTTSPSPTSKSTPCRMWLSPYQALRPATFSITPWGCFSAIAAPQIGRDHLGVARHGGVVALGENLAAGEHGDAVAQA